MHQCPHKDSQTNVCVCLCNPREWTGQQSPTDVTLDKIQELLIQITCTYLGLLQYTKSESDKSLQLIRQTDG